MLCILTSFWVLCTPKSWSNYFFQPFSTFCVHFKPFSVISGLKSTKTIWKRTKKRVFVCSLKLVDMQKLVDSLRGYNKKGWKRLHNKYFDQLLGELVEIHNQQVNLNVLEFCRNVGTGCGSVSCAPSLHDVMSQSELTPYVYYYKLYFLWILSIW